MVVSGQRHVPADLPAGKSPSTPCTVGLFDPRACLDDLEKQYTLVFLSGFEPRTFHPVASRIHIVGVNE
jgi:hypothetical protein